MILLKIPNIFNISKKMLMLLELISKSAVSFVSAVRPIKVWKILIPLSGNKNRAWAEHRQRIAFLLS